MSLQNGYGYICGAVIVATSSVSAEVTMTDDVSCMIGVPNNGATCLKIAARSERHIPPAARIRAYKSCGSPAGITSNDIVFERSNSQDEAPFNALYNFTAKCPELGKVFQ